MRFPLLPPLLTFALIAGLLLLIPWMAPPAEAPEPLAAFDPARDDDGTPDLEERAVAVDDLSWLVGERPADADLTRRSSLLAEKERLRAAGDAAGLARVNAVLAGEAFARAARVVDDWLARQDARTDLFPNSLQTQDQAWLYGDTGADLFGFLAIGAAFLAPERYPAVLETLAAERKLKPAVPDDVTLPDERPLGRSPAERVFGVAEYAKDGLLPAFERLGPDPWLGRLTELADAIVAEARVPTPRGPIPADSAEVNGDMLQLLARLAWATGEPRYREAAERIALAYLDVLPTTKYLPPHRWDFIENEPIERRRFRLSDHGNEILSGLLEWHLGETLRGEPDAVEHRARIRKMLDRLLEKGRNADGLWYRVVEIPSGEVEQDGLTDNWGYLLQAYLTAAIVERTAPDGDPAREARYREAARQALVALVRYPYYEWQHGEMDGYADTLESALYLLNDEPVPTAADWVDRQTAVLYGFQEADGDVLGRDLDGNFIRTTLLYAFSQTQGLSLAPWREGVLLGAARDGDCLAISLSSPAGWSGRLVFDTPRHRLYLRAPVDYPRLNEWPEWFVAEPERSYDVEGLEPGSSERWPGAQLAEGVPMTLHAGEARALRVCAAGS